MVVRCVDDVSCYVGSLNLSVVIKSCVVTILLTQREGEGEVEYWQDLRHLASECVWCAVYQTAEKHLNR